MKALEDICPFGLFKHFYMIRALRNLKQPNVITSQHIWGFLETGFDLKKYDKEADRKINEGEKCFDEIFQE